MTTTSEANSVTKKRNLYGFDTVNGVRIVGEWVGGSLSHFNIANPVTITVGRPKDADENSTELTIGANPLLFTSGTIYTVNPDVVMGHYLCEDLTIHAVYEKAIKGPEKTDAVDNSAAGADA